MRVKDIKLCCEHFRMWDFLRHCNCIFQIVSSNEKSHMFFFIYIKSSLCWSKLWCSCTYFWIPWCVNSMWALTQWLKKAKRNHLQLIPSRTLKACYYKYNTFLIFSPVNIWLHILTYIYICIYVALPDKQTDISRDCNICGVLLKHINNHRSFTFCLELHMSTSMRSPSTPVHGSVHWGHGKCCQEPWGMQAFGPASVLMLLPKLIYSKFQSPMQSHWKATERSMPQSSLLDILSPKNEVTFSSKTKTGWKLQTGLR